MRTFLATLAILSGISSGLARGGPVEDLLSLMEAEVSECRAETVKLTESYRARLQSLSATYQEQGDLTGLLAVKEEIENPGSTKTSPHEELSSLRKIYNAALPAAVDRDRKESLRILGDYKAKFEALTSQWTRDGELDKATKALEQSKRINARILDLATLSLTAKSGFPNRNGGRPGEVCRDGLGLSFCWIPPGSFKMGSPADEAHRKPRREDLTPVELTRGFWLSQFEITQKQFAGIMGEHRNSNQGDPSRLPAEEVTWERAVEFCRLLTERERLAGRLSDGWVYALPSEHQWEYACRAGDSSPTPGGTMEEMAWTADNSEKLTQAVGTRSPNAWGLHDMLGNVWEWTSTAWSDKAAAGKDPLAEGDDTQRIIRGSSAKGGVAQTRAAHRDARKKTFQWNDLGFRPTLVPVP